VPKIAAFVVAQLVSLGLALAVAFATSMIPGLRPPPDVVGINVSWPVLVEWALILLFVSPALYRYFSRLFGAEAGEPNPRVRSRKP
jgi:hypothetical protein